MSEIEKSRRWCRHVMRVHAKSFYFSTRILPPHKRNAVEALYAICRTADDAADEPGFRAEDRRVTLEQIARDVAHLRDAHYTARAPWFASAQDAFASFPIPIPEVLRLIAGCTSDIEGRTIGTMDDLERYANDVAGTVGRCAMAILGAADDDSLLRGERLGVAMQLTNVLRDIDEDTRMGRNYLPLEASGVSPVEIARAIARRAHELYREADVLARRVPNDGSRAALVLTRIMYEAILEKIEQRGFAVGMGRAHVSFAEKTYLAARGLLVFYTGLKTIK